MHLVNVLSIHMPHFIIEYSPNIESNVDMAGLCDLIRTTAGNMDTFPMPGVRVRAIAVNHYSIADGNAKHGFIDISVRLRAGRTLEVRKEAINTLFIVVRDYLAPVMKDHSLALSFEMRDIDPELSPKCGKLFLSNFALMAYEIPLTVKRFQRCLVRRLIISHQLMNRLFVKWHVAVTLI